jgi:3-hydroxyacyl-CoA dehydrogenase
MAIEKAAVIGAGVMGAGIAAQMANAGIDVELLDIVPKGAADRDMVAKGAIEKMAKTNPAPLMHKNNARRIRPGNIEDHLDRLAHCDLIVEAVLEDPAIKSALFKKIDPQRKKGSIVASNTSTIPLHDLTAGQSEDFRRDFMVTHFFNPPRYMPLLELVTSPHNRPEKIAEVVKFMDEKMGKGVVACNDTPGFIANRIGTFWLQCAINEAYNKKLTVEEADALMGRPIGVPKTGVFGLIDLVGLDLMPHISKSLSSELPADDGYCRINKTYPVINKMIADGYTGRKGKGGFYRLNTAKEKLAVDLETGTERPAAKIKLKKKSLRELVDGKDRNGAYVWSVLQQTLCYTAEHAAEIAANVAAVDEAMRLGYNWKYGPFELIDKLGVDYLITRLKAENIAIPILLEKAAGRSFYRVDAGKLQFLNNAGSYETVRRPDGVLLLSDIKRAKKPVARNISASLWDIGDGVLCAEFHSKMNALDLFSMRILNRACDIIGDGKGSYKALVIHNEGDDFSVGANIGIALYAAKLKQYWIVRKMVTLGQETYKRLKYAPFPVVAAPSGKALGGGCEALLHSHHVQAHAETYPGLVEVGVGLLPAWGGSTELLTRAQQNKKMPGGLMPPVAAVFEVISLAKVGLSAFEAKDLMYLRATDGVTMNKYRLLADAKAKAVKMVKNFAPEKPFDLELPGPGGAAALNLAVDGFYLKAAATPYDVVVSDKVARVLTGGAAAGPGVKLSQDYVRRLELENFMTLLHDGRTIARIESIIKSGKPLREKPIPGKTAAALRAEADHPSLLARLCGCLKSNNNTNGLTIDPKPRVNWPSLKAFKS